MKNLFSKEKTVSANPLPSKEPTRWDKIKSYLDERGYIGCSFIIPFAIMWMIFIALRVFPFGANSVLVLDLNGQYVYFFEALRKAIYGDASLLYSWSRALGGEFLGIYAYYLASPFSYIVALFPEANMTEALLTIILLKCGFSGATMSWYLKKTRPNANEMVTISIACMYALSSYAVVQAHNTMWIDALIWLPLLVYGLEQLIKKQKFVLFTISLTMTLLSNFYIGYMVCIFVFLYFFYYYFSGSAGENNFYKEKLHFLKSLVRTGAASFIAILGSAIVLLPTYYSLSFGKTDFSKVIWKNEFTSRFDILQFISKLFLGSYDTVRPEGLPFVYCGMAALILLPLYFATKKVKLREKIGALALMLFLVLSMNLSALDIIWHGMQKPNWLNYRYSFLLIFLMLIFAHRALEEIESIRTPYVVASSVSIAGLLIIVQFANYSYVDTFYTIWLSIIFIIIYTALLIPIMRGMFKPILLTGLAVVICVEAFVGGIINTNSLDADVTFSPRDTSSQSWLEGYSDFLSRMRGITELVQESDSSFYRMENSDTRKVCDNHALNLRGISGSTSTLNAKTVKFLNRIGYLSVSHWSQYKGQTELNDALMGIKYAIYTSELDSDILSLYTQYDYQDSKGEDKTLYAYKNPYALSMAYVTDDDILDFVAAGYSSPFEFMNDMVSAMLGEENAEIYKSIPYEISPDKATASYSVKTYSETVYDKDGNIIPDERRNVNYYYCEKKGENPKMFFTFTVPELERDKVQIYAYLPTSYARDASWECNGLSGALYDSGCEYISNLEMLESGKEYTFTVEMKSDNLYVDQNAGMFYYLDTEAFESAMNRLANGNMEIESFTESSLKGTINAQDSTTVFTSIPYDENWNVYVDGKKVEYTKTCDALIAFDLGSTGEHTLEIVYHSKQLKLGFTCLAAGIFLFAGWVLLDKKLLSKAHTKPQEDVTE